MLSSPPSCQRARSTTPGRPTDGYRLCFAGFDGLKHYLGHRFFDIKRKAGNCVVQEKRITLVSRDRALLKIGRFFIGDNGNSNCVECVFPLSFDVCRWFCSFTTVVLIWTGLSVFRHRLMTLREETFWFFSCRDGTSTRDIKCCVVRYFRDCLRTSAESQISPASPTKKEFVVHLVVDSEAP